MYPEGVLGKPSLARAEKAYPAIENYLNYVVKLHNDIRAKFPPGVLPEAKHMTQRSEEEIDLLLKDRPGRQAHLHGRVAVLSRAREPGKEVAR